MITLRDLASLVAEYPDDVGHLDRPAEPFRIGDDLLDTDADPILMGVVNLSADSWYRESVTTSREAAVRRGTVLAAQGARLVDVGAESVVGTAARVGARQQTASLVPVVEELAAAGVAVSVESYYPEVVEAALRAGARVVNLSGSADDGAIFALAAEHRAAVVLCHIDGSHARDLHADGKAAGDPIPAMLEQFERRLDLALGAGVPSVAVDPGIGFGFSWAPTARARAGYQAAVLLQSFRLRRLGMPVCHALPAAAELFGEEVRTAEGFFAVLAALGGTGIYRTHEVPRVAAVLAAVRDLAVRPPALR